MQRRGHVIARSVKGQGYLGDYYVLGSKKSQYFYVALSHVKSYAITKEFLFNKLFP